MHGVTCLSDKELLQVILGSGTKRHSAAKIAHQTVDLLIDGEATYAAFCDVPGMGSAKACQVLAALELGKRYEARH